MKNMDKLKDKLATVHDLNMATAVLHWDLEVYMPPKGAAARGQQIATLSSLAHRFFTASEIGDLLAACQTEAATLSEDENALVAETAYDYERAVKLPEDLVKRFAQTQSKAYEAWVKARAASDYSLFQEPLKEIIALNREKAECFGYEGSPYNALLEEFERGMTAEQLDVIFGRLAQEQSVLVQEIADSPEQPKLDWLEQEWDTDKQWEFTLRVLKDMGYDFDAGRQDRSVHPFTTNFDLYDVRVTTRLNAKELFSALTGSIHEGGHALYEQGFRPEDQGTVLASAPSLGIHESQSRMWENMIGRSAPFWKYYAPAMKTLYPGQLDSVDADMMYRAVNHVQPSLIRVEADECTYNLHIILRYELERALIEGSLEVADVPAAWNEKIKQYLGLDVPDDAQGCLQDIHWSHGAFGYFPTYALGNLYAAQLFEKIEQDIPALWTGCEKGDFTALLEWLRTQVHRVGRRKTAPQIVQDATGNTPDSDAYLRYLSGKYGKLYAIR